MRSVLQTTSRHLSNLPGWRTNRKIVVIESDDWGSIRMPSMNVFDTLQKAGIDLISGDGARYNLNDTLASENDLSALYDTFAAIEKKFGKKPVFTAVSLVANPDFDKIRLCNYDEYFYEPFTTTLQRYGKENAFTMWKQGIEEGLFSPEFHGREHLNVSQWMRSLKNGDKHTLEGFKHGFWGFISSNGNNYQAAFYLDQPEDLLNQEKAVKEGLHLFEKLHGYKARFFVPPNGAINNKLEEIAAIGEVQYISTPKILEESLGGGKSRKHMRWLGKKNNQGQLYITRNAFFEPNLTGEDWIGKCLKDINIAFKWRKPAVISSHRTNYIGSLNEKNRELGLDALSKLLSKIIMTWPKVEFMTSAQLGRLINSK